MTPLHRASERGHLEPGQFLVEHGADAAQDNDGQTPIDRASKMGHVKLAQFLVEQHGLEGPEISTSTNCPFTAEADFGRAIHSGVETIHGHGREDCSLESNGRATPAPKGTREGEETKEKDLDAGAAISYYLRATHKLPARSA